MSLINKILVSTALFACVTSHAFANTFSLGSSFDSSIYKAPTAPTFVDLYTFNLSSAGSISYTVTESTVSPLINIDFLSFGLFDSNRDVVTNATNLTAGTYLLRITGDITGVAGGVYNLKFALTPSVVTPIPEPETNALMVLGLGLLGLIARRKYA